MKSKMSAHEFEIMYDKYKNLLFRNKFTIDDNKSNDSPYGSFSDYAYLNPYNRLHDEDGEMEDSWTGLVTE